VDAHAALLADRGVRKGDRVAVLGTKRVATVIAILALSRAGAVYVPVDPSLPEARIRFMLEDAQVSLVVGPATHAQQAFGRPFVAVDDPARASAPRAFPSVLPEDPAYMMYTSGSTGVPKAAVIAHRQVHAFFEAHNELAGISAGDRCMNTGGFHFDVSILDVFLPLYVGASVVLTPELPMPSLLLSVIARMRITHFYAVGTVLQRMTGDGTLLDRYRLDSLRLLQTGAERCNPQVVNQWLSRLPELGFLNSYGPTEVTVGCVCYRKPLPGPLPNADVPIGRVHRGSRVVLLGDDGSRVARPHLLGELLVAGAQVMCGYWNRPEESEAAMIVLHGERFYRTGDRAYYDDNGQLHFAGRRDDCVKVEGVRVHLIEIERLLERHPDVVRAAAFVVRDRAQRTKIACAVTCAREPSHADLVGLLALGHEHLSTAVAPIAVVACQALPNTSSGKADVRAIAALTEAVLKASSATTFRLCDDRLLPTDSSPQGKTP
jgi:D-alanine--poly(phosphoribitol) ligase subunit 1